MTLRELINQIVELYHSLIDFISELFKAGWKTIKLLWELLLDMPLWYFLVLGVAICLIVFAKEKIDKYKDKRRKRT